MFSAIKTLLRGRKGFRWSLYFVRKGKGLAYALHENAVICLLGYVLAPIEKGKSISADWELHINFNQRHKAVRLNEGFFIESQIAPELLVQIQEIDPDFMVQAGKPVFMDVASREVLPLGSAYEAAFQSPEELARSSIEMLQGQLGDVDFDQRSLENVMKKVFISGND